METGYSEHEWATLLFAPLWVFQAAVEAGGKTNDRKWQVFNKACQAAREYRNDLSRDVFAELAAHFDELRAGFERDEADVSAGLAEVAILLKREDEETAWGFKADMVAMAIQAARADGDARLDGEDQVADRLFAVLGTKGGDF